MTKVQELQNAIQSLSSEDFAALRKWMNELDWEQWDKEIEQDSQSGKLDFLIEEALAKKAKLHDHPQDDDYDWGDVDPSTLGKPIKYDPQLGYFIDIEENSDSCKKH